MPVLSYVVFPAPGRTAALAETLAALDGCEVELAENRELLLLVTSTASAAEDRALRARVESERDIEALVLAFGEIDPGTEEGDPVAAAREAERSGLRLPVLDRTVSALEGGRRLGNGGRTGTRGNVGDEEA